jgi:hypothetical protein
MMAPSDRLFNPISLNHNLYPTVSSMTGLTSCVYGTYQKKKTDICTLSGLQFIE